MTSGKRRQTFSKMTRERAVKEKRERKQEKKDEKKAAAAAANTEGADLMDSAPVADEEIPGDDARGA